ncbi:hypothetical protein [uncultured Salipiger sp.]|uniref:hypothetical protein n=1 Tax=uncultured Salipiger sp. TaxID=499810 RepID=UPI00259A886C|nr:hypothetical protein [uncultured Salipiger sp.]
MILDRISTLLAHFGLDPDGRARAAEHGEIWRSAAAREPRILGDLIREGGLFEGQPVVMKDGIPSRAPIDPYRMAYEAGRRDFAAQLLSAGGLTHTQIEQLTKDQDYEY